LSTTQQALDKYNGKLFCKFLEFEVHQDLMTLTATGTVKAAGEPPPTLLSSSNVLVVWKDAQTACPDMRWRFSRRTVFGLRPFDSSQTQSGRLI
jgi:hypothetical protein